MLKVVAVTPDYAEVSKLADCERLRRARIAPPHVPGVLDEDRVSALGFRLDFGAAENFRQDRPRVEVDGLLQADLEEVAHLVDDVLEAADLVTALPAAGLCCKARVRGLAEGGAETLPVVDLGEPVRLPAHSITMVSCERGPR